MLQIMVELRAAEGGEDARLLCIEQFAIYSKFCARSRLEIEIVEERPGFIVFQVTGSQAEKYFANEAGGHRFQRVPPTEKRGRVQSSTITVAVLPIPSETSLRIAERDLEWRTCRGSGPGGQHRNKTESAVQLTHLPTKETVRVESGRSQHQNRVTALALLRSRLAEKQAEKERANRNSDRKAQVGVGARSDKRRTVAIQRGEVVDHDLGRRIRFSDYAAGKLEGFVG